MKRTRFTRILSLLCALALCLGFLPALGVHAADEVLLSDDFSAYKPGDDTFFNANTSAYTYYENYHGTLGGESWSAYGIAEEGGNRFLHMISHNETRNWFVPKVKMNGSFSVQVNVRLGEAASDDCTPSLILNPFQGNNFGAGVVLLYVDPRWGVRISDQATDGKANYIYVRESGANFKPAYGKWYTVKLTAETGKLTAAVWPKGESEPTGSDLHAVWESPLLTADVLAKNNQLRIQNMERKKPGLETVVDLDDLIITGSGTGVGKVTGTDLAGSAATIGGSSGGGSAAPVDDGGSIGADLGSNAWVLLSETFESYAEGEDAFYDANKALYNYISSYHGTAGTDSYSTYGIARDGEGKVLKLTSWNATRNWFTTKKQISGAWDVTLRVKLAAPEDGAGTPSFILNPFEGKTVGSGTTLLYVDPYNGSRISDGSTTGTAQMIFGENAKIKPAYDTWYCVKLSVRVGKLIAKIWAQGTEEPAEGAAGTIVWNTPLLTGAELAKPSSLRINNMERKKEGKNTTVYVDDLRFTKPYDKIDVAPTVFGTPGDALVALPAFTGQDLSRQEPAPAYKYTLGDGNLGAVNASGTLTLGPGEGTTALTMELLDLTGAPTGVKANTTLVVGSSYGITPDPDKIKVPESDIGKTVTVNLAWDDAVKSAYPAAAVRWKSGNEAVAAVSAAGVVTLTGFGSTVITAEVFSGDTATGHFANIPVQVGEKALRVLFVGNSFSRDTSFYMSSLARVAGKRVEAAYLQKDSGTIRQMARNIAQSKAEYSYWKANPMTGEMVWQRKTTVQDAMSDGVWDVIVTHPSSGDAGMRTIYDEDLHFVLDYFHDAQPGAKIYWNATWAYQQDVSSKSTTAATNFKNWYDGDQAVMFNANCDRLDEFIIGKSTEFGAKLDGWLPVGQALQNLRATYGDIVTRDGYHLSLSVGRLTAGLAALKALYPDMDLGVFTAESVAPFLDLDRYDEGIKDDDDTTYDNTEANMAKVRAAVAEATKDLTRAPARLPAPAGKKVESATKQGDYTIVQTQAPMKLHFPDVITLKDGTVLVCAYEAASHTPSTTQDDTWASNGPGRLLVWRSTDNGKTFDYDKPVLVVDQKQMEAWGVCELSGRYAKWKAGQNDYIVLADPRDPNFGLSYVDVTGDGVKDEVLLFTFWVRNFKESGSKYSIHMVQSIDGGRTWYNCQPIRSKLTGVVLKRGDMTYFSDGQILIPTYVSGKIYAIRMGWDSNTKSWVTLSDAMIPDPAPEETGSNEYNEMSFIAPDPDKDTVFGFIRANGAVMRSDDRGATWTMIGNEPGLIHQPGFAAVDKERVFATWARTSSPRTVYGKMFYVNGNWADTEKQTVYASPLTSTHDMADPSAKLLANGQILAVSYDTAYRSIVGTLIDPNSKANRITEMNKDAAEIVLAEDTAPSGSSVTLTAAEMPDSYVAYATAAFTAGGKVTFELSNGAKVVFEAGKDGIEAGKTYTMAAIAAGASAYKKAWEAGTDETDVWAGVTGGSAANSGKVVVTASGATLQSAKLARKVTVEFPSQIRGIANGPAVDSRAVILPASARAAAVWTVADTSLATVDTEGKITCLKAGNTTLSVTISGSTFSAPLVVAPEPAELTGEGERKVIFSDDFEEYEAGENTFWTAMEKEGWISNGSAPTATSYYNITQKDGGKALEMISYSGKATWAKVNTPIYGDYTARFDFMFTGARTNTSNASAPGQYLYLTLWQDSGMSAFLHLTPEGIRVQYTPAGATSAVNEPSDFGSAVVYELNKWHTIRMTRVDGGLYVKIWEAGTPEPEEWTMVSMHEELATDNSGSFRMQYYVTGNSERTMYVDNVLLTQQAVKGAAAMRDVSPSDWFYGAVDWAIRNDVMSGYSADTFGPNNNLNRAMLVQMLYNREGKPAVSGASRFTDVPDSQWYAAAVNWAAEKGVVSGYGALYKPEQNITRQELAQMLYNYAGKPAAEADLSKFPDAGKIDGWAANALKWAVANGVMSGKGGGYLDPLGRATRAEAAQMLKNYLDK